MPRVKALAIAPVKGLRLLSVGSVELTASGPRGDRQFVLVDEDGAVVETQRTPALAQVAAVFEDPALTLRFPDGTTVTEEPRRGARATTRLYGDREVTGALVDGELAAALGEHLGRRVRLLALEPGQTGADDNPVTLMSEASRAAVGAALGQSALDARRFRMTITIDGVGAWEEHGWAGGRVAVGAALLRVLEPVPRCVVTTRDPDDGHRDAPVLKALAQLRGKEDVTFGVWCAVEEPGRVTVGDAVERAG